MVADNSLNSPAIVIAEVANSHEGDEAKLDAIVDSVIKHQIPLVKFQVLRAAEFYDPAHERYALFEGLEFDFSVWIAVFNKLRSAGIQPCADVFSEAGAADCVEAGIKTLKLHSSDAFNRPLLEMVGGLDLDMLILGVGGLFPFEIADMLDQVMARSKTNLVLMQGQQGYPTSREDNNLEKLSWLVEHFSDVAKIGYADHSPGNSAAARELCDVAIAAGATVIEKHVSPDISAKGIDHESAVNVEDLPGFISGISTSDTEPAPVGFKLGGGELRYRDSVIKRSVLDGKSGQILYRRESGLPPAIPRGIALSPQQALGHQTDGTYRRVAAVIIVRLSSNRLPRKAVAPLGDSFVLETLIDNLRSLNLFDDLVIATSVDPGDDEIVSVGEAKNVPVFRGSPDNPADRIVGALDFLDAANGVPVTHFARMTGDNPFPVEQLHHKIRETLTAEDFDYLRADQAPLGLNSEYFNVAFFRYFARAINESNRTEYLTYFVDRQWDQIVTRTISLDGLAQLRGRYSIDYEEDRQYCENYLAFAKKGDHPILSLATLQAWETSLDADNLFSPPIKRPLDATYLVRWGQSLTSNR